MFFDMTFRSLWRHKTRSFLTGMGVVLAIAAIVSLGSISEGINNLVQQQLKFESNLISVTEKDDQMSFSTGMPGLGSKIPKEVVDEIAQIDGVATVSPQIMQISLDNNLMVIGISLDDTEIFDLQNIDFTAGGYPDEGEKELFLGYQAAEMNKLSVGDEVLVKGDKYVVSGILEEMYNFVDYAAIGPITDIADTFDMEDYYTSLSIEPADVSDSKRIANEIMEAYDTLDAMTSDEALKMADEIVGQIRLMTLSIGVVASLVASIGIINTMIVVVLERKQEFGIMKALGAKRVVILSIVIQEAVVIGVIGSILGIFIGYAGTEGINKASAFPIASVTPTLALFSLLYGILLCVVASLYPSYSAINVDPVESMRET